MKPFTIALIGPPNVGKSTLFNRFCPLYKKQHTGNWAGKTVSDASTHFRAKGQQFRFIDLPGIYALHEETPEQKHTADFLQHGAYDAVITVADCTAPDRGIALLLQVLQITKKVILCLNLSDTAAKKGIHADTQKLSALLGIPVLSIEAQKSKDLSTLPLAALAIAQHTPQSVMHPLFPKQVTTAIHALLPDITAPNPKAKALQFLCTPPEQLASPFAEKVSALLAVHPTLPEQIKTASIATANRLCALSFTRQSDAPKPCLADRILTGKLSGTVCMLLFLTVILWLTVCAATYCSDALALWFDAGKRGLTILLSPLPSAVYSLLLDGIYTVVSFVVSVMLPPLLIFFPLFRLLEEAGFLPRLAYALDPCLCKANTGGKQALTMCMGLGCNALGISGCRIIGAKSERETAMLTNVFTPCNGKLPLLISLLSIFCFRGESTWLTALGLTGILLFSFGISFFATWLLSKTLYRGKREPLILELPAWRKPDISKLFLLDLFKKTLEILSRALIGALFAGILLWLLTHLTVHHTTLLSHFTAILEPVGRFFGMDGVILAAFLLGFPANEIVLPIMLMSYTAGSVPVSLTTDAVAQILTQNGWDLCTALCVLLFALMHAPCLTAILTLYKESGSLKKTLLGIAFPTLFGLGFCLFVKGLFALVEML